MSRNNHPFFGDTGGAGLHPAADFQSARCNWAHRLKSADTIGAQDAILPHLIDQLFLDEHLVSSALPRLTTWINGEKIAELDTSKVQSPGWDPQEGPQ